MRKLSFYPRLALGNLWRNRGTYLPYLLACIISIFTFYTLLAINTNGALNGMRGEGVVKSFTLIGTIIMALFCSALIFYTNSFLVKRRKRELGLYSILGMEKKNIALVMFFETIFMAVLALVLGLALGMLLSKLLFWVLLRMVHFPVMLDMPVSLAAAGITCALFGVIFLMALLFNLRQVRLANPIELVAAAKQGEREPKASWVLTVLGLVCIGAGYYIALRFTSPIEALMYFLVAVLLVIIGTYCLFTSGSIALLKLLRKNKKYYYQPGHFISVSGMIYRMKQNAAGLATICILSCMVLVTVSSTVALNAGVEDSLNNQYPYEYAITFYEPADGDLLLSGAEQIAAAEGIKLTALQDYRNASFMADEQDGTFMASEDYQGMNLMTLVELFLLEDYNHNEGAGVTLAPGEALLLVTGGRYDGDSLTMNGVPLKVRHLEAMGKANSMSRDLGRSMYLVLPDEAAMNAILAGGGVEQPMRRNLAFDTEGSEAAREQFHQDYGAFVGGLTTQNYFNYRSREGGRDDWYASNGGFLFLGIYFGVLFMLAAVLIIYYKQMSEGYDDAARFEILQKVGMGADEVKSTINKQILAVFFLPLVVAVIHVAVAFFPVSRAMVIFGVVNTQLLVVFSLATVLVYALVYLLVFRRTARTYFRIVRR
ncbi:FtsX-like permease family protein [Ruminococcaceae bacterium OttesenSCG-928-O06]|nr:FtsX-like permease family protein [Ruminococcaceae bacterium OttesenSCG-928-O06]